MRVGIRSLYSVALCIFVVVAVLPFSVSVTFKNQFNVALPFGIY